MSSFLRLKLMGKLSCRGMRGWLKVKAKAVELRWDPGSLVPSLPHLAEGPCLPAAQGRCVGLTRH
jgi:hypothetical protein